MLNPDLKLNPKIFEADVDQAPIRAGFGEGLLRAADSDTRVVGLCADLTESTHMLAFKKKFPERFVEIGVAEQNLAAVASGLAAMGKIPFLSSYAVFSPGRNWEQIRTTVAYNNQPIKIAGSHAGVSVGPDGGSHQALEDLAIMRVLPRMVVIAPCDAIEARKATLAAAKNDQPTYIRLAREKTPIITTEATPFTIGQAAVFFHSTGDFKLLTDKLDVALIATGSLMYEALRAANALHQSGKKVAVLNLPTVKPLDEGLLLLLARQAGALVTVEEHQAAGGMGSTVAEYLAAHYPVPIEFVGVKDRFGQSGTPAELIKLYNLDAASIQAAALRAALRKK